MIEIEGRELNLSFDNFAGAVPMEQPPEIPAPASAALLGLGLLGAGVASAARRRAMRLPVRA